LILKVSDDEMRYSEEDLAERRDLSNYKMPPIERVTYMLFGVYPITLSRVKWLEKPILVED
jgi:hypothetical protein